MRQEIYVDEFEMSEWDLNTSSRCFVRLADSKTWKGITGSNPPTIPPTAREYTAHGLPWFDYYADKAVLKGSDVLFGLKSVFNMGKAKNTDPLPENESTEPDRIIKIRKKMTPDQVREWRGRA